MTEEFAEELGKLKKLCPHFHLSLQSGCDATLKRMNRRYTTREYCEKVDILRRVFGSPAITTDVIVGFPGETEEEFAETKAFLEKVSFTKCIYLSIPEGKAPVLQEWTGRWRTKRRRKGAASSLLWEKSILWSLGKVSLGGNWKCCLKKRKILQGNCFR